MKQLSPLILLGLLSSGCSSLESLRVSSPFWGEEVPKSSAPQTTVTSAPPIAPADVPAQQNSLPPVDVDESFMRDTSPKKAEPAKGWRFHLGMFVSPKEEDRSMDKPVVDPVGDVQVDMEPPTGRLKAIPAPAEPMVSERDLNPRDPSEAEVFAMENRWFHENIWLYSDGKYASKSPQMITGKWNKTGGLLRLQPYHGGLLLFSKGEHGPWVSEAGGASTLRPVRIPR